MVAAIVSGTALYYLLVTICYGATRIGYGRARAAGPRRSAVDPADLDPYELAMLAGGRRRVGEVALAELFLTGRIVARGHGAVARTAHEPRTPPPPLSATPFVRMLDARIRHQRPLPAHGLVVTATQGDAATAVLWRLRRLGLFFAPAPLRAVCLIRNAAWASHTLTGMIGVLFAGFTVVWVTALTPIRGPLMLALFVLFLGYPFLLHVAHRWIGGVQGSVGAAVVVTAAGALAGRFAGELLLALALFAGWFAVFAVYRCTGGRLGPRTVAGDAALVEARQELAHQRGPGLDELLRLTALLGFRRLRGRGLGELGEAPVGRTSQLARLVAFAAACGRSLGAADRGLGGDFAFDGGSGEWGGDGDAIALDRDRAPRGGHDRKGPAGDRP